MDPKSLRTLCSYSCLIKEANEYALMAQAFLEAGDVKAWSYYLLEAQSANDEASRRIDIQQGIDQGQRQVTWMSKFGVLTPLI